MPVPFRKRKRQPRGQVSNRSKAEDLTSVAPAAAETDDEGTPRNGPPRAKTKHRGESSGEYRPL